MSSGSSCFFQLRPLGSPYYYTPEVEWEARLRMLVRNLRTKKVEYWVKVSESYGASLLGSSGIKAVKRFSLTTLTLFRC